MILERVMLRRGGRRHRQLLRERVEHSLSNNVQREALVSGTRFIRAKSVESYSNSTRSKLNLQDVRRIKRESISHLSENVERFISSAESHGARVFLAETKKDATDYVARVLSEAGARNVVKSKSMVTEELDLNRHLAEAGFTVIETDLGERIVQLAGQRPSHIIAPVIHLNRKQIADIFAKSLGRIVPDTPEEITNLARKLLRKDFLNAEAGISGANAGIAEDGSVLIVTNEGNERLVTSIPPLYIAVMGIEKIVPTLTDALKVTNALCMSATGQKITSYVSIIRGPNEGVGMDRKEMHIVLLNDGRTTMAQDNDSRQALYCLKCGSCLNVCPTYRQVGGHVFGKAYTGPIGIPWTSFTDSMDAAAEFAPLCISCGLCKLACPVDINIPLLIAQVKEANVNVEGQLPVNWFLSHYDYFIRLMSRTAPLTNRLLINPTFRWLLEKVMGIESRRTFPRFERKTFEDWHKGQPTQKNGANIVYFVDTYANFNNPSIGIAATKLLSKAGYTVLFPPQKGSGMPAFLYGELNLLREIAQFNVNSLLHFALQGTPIVASEPTAAFCLREIYPELLRTEESRTVARNSYELLGFLHDHPDMLPKVDKVTVARGKIAYYPPCHTRALYTHPPAKDLLNRFGLNVETVDLEGCCGIAGTYGFKKGYDGFTLSMAIGEELFKKIGEMKPDLIVTESSVCKLQIEQGLGLPVRHPLELLYENAVST